ncbi:hypothetical protein [Burkholderia sp. Ax-1719]|uniref:hypothetical protein n=1 Tax=Burkholderia sp. Ax-1719 TaxID=2608334 RepID=UPI0014219A71|nr:hypothetical protein [Burkholderia sp. Ax-1719]NIE66892.1 hypothetical protein [Burkholderia sp. Ax-1719]
MATISQIRGALLEEAVLFLLQKIGYEVFDPRTLAVRPIDGLRSGHSGLEVRGRGTWHQLDAFALWRHSPAFMYPLQLMVEAKCYSAHRPVQIEVPRNAVGVLKDISENFFTVRTRRGSIFQAVRYNYAAAIFSTSGFTRGAIEYAIAHQVFLIQYEDVPAIQPLVDAIFSFDETCLKAINNAAASAVRTFFRAILNGENVDIEIESTLTASGITLLTGSIVRACTRIQGSYFGMLQGRWPLHLLRAAPLPPSAFTSDTVRCEVRGNDRNEWKFVPANLTQGDSAWFELEFSLPPLIAELVADAWDDDVAVAQIKQEHFSFIDLAGVIGGIQRNVRLELDANWIRTYLERRRSR